MEEMRTSQIPPPKPRMGVLPDVIFHHIPVALASSTNEGYGVALVWG